MGGVANRLSGIRFLPETADEALLSHPLRDISDIEAIEQTPLEDRLRISDFYLRVQIALQAHDQEDGERGELVVTPLVKEAMPLLRYRTGDVTVLMEDGCLCRRGQKIARITGRSDDMLVIRGINVFPSQIEHVLLKIPELAINLWYILTE